MSQVRIISHLLKVTPSEAAEFCQQVRKLCIEIDTPSNGQIAECMKKNPKARTVEPVAKKLKPILRKQGGKYRSRKKLLSGGGNVGGDELPLSTPLIARDPRPYTDGLEVCPHGVLKIKKCAICDPDGWRIENGWD